MTEKADKMFEELGYIKEKDNALNTIYKTEGEGFLGYITFNHFQKDVGLYIEECDPHDFPSISMEELKAINKKCEELGWI